jgi:hypothetical protein
VKAHLVSIRQPFKTDLKSWLYLAQQFVIVKAMISGNIVPVWVRKLTGKPGGHTSPDCEFKARRIHRIYETGLSFWAAESKAPRIHSDFLFRDLAIAACIVLASGGVNRAVRKTTLAFCVPTFGLPTLFFIIIVTQIC